RVTAVAASRVKRDAHPGENDNVGLRAFRFGYPHAKSGQNLPGCRWLALQQRQGKEYVLDNPRMQRARRGVQDRLPVDQLPPLLVGAPVGELVEFIDRHGAGLDRGNAHGASSCAQPFTSTGPGPCGRSPSFMMPSRLATSV